MHHVHVWEVGPGQRVLTAHVSVPEMGIAASEALFGRMKTFLHETWSIEHATLEAEVNGCGDERECGAPVESSGVRSEA